MALLTVARYRQITGDQDTADATITARAEDAVDLLAETLGRPVESDERTERMWPDRDGRLWPAATPITTAAGYTIAGDSLQAGMWWSAPGYADVTYTGGWVERSADPDAANALPACIERDLAWAVYTLAHPATPPPGFPAGASAVSLGDTSVTLDRGSPPGATSGMWSRQTLAYRARRLAAYPPVVTFP